MEVVLVIVGVIILYIVLLKVEIANLKDEMSKIKEEKQYELITKVNEHAIMKNNEFNMRVESFVRKINELQYIVNCMLDEKPKRQVMKRSLIKDDLENAINTLIVEQNNINASYIKWQEKITNEKDVKLKDIKGLEVLAEKERKKINIERKNIYDEINRYSWKRRNEFVTYANEIIQNIKHIQSRTKLLLREEYDEDNIKYISEEGDTLEKAKKAILWGQGEIEKDYNRIQEKAMFAKKLLESSLSEFPFVATALADYYTAKEQATIDYLTQKKHSALKSREEVAEIKKEKKKCLEELFAYKWEIAYLHDLLPWLADMEDEPVKSIVTHDNYVGDNVANWISPVEYQKLSVTERNQLALERYINRKKTKREIGREYERYIGYRYEMDGYKVKYFGVEQGLEDLGRDLICYGKGKILVVQCKCWSKKKEIHENHINQLFGTTVMYYFTEINPKGCFNELYEYLKSGRLVPVFITTTNYSSTALQFARALNVSTDIVQLEDYPMIKCNVNGSTGEKIYHLPFDQQYDKCIINSDEGKFYAKTVKEAEDKGYRRAMKWHGNGINN